MRLFCCLMPKIDQDIFYGIDSEDENCNAKHQRKISAYPSEWASSFGDSYYSICASKNEIEKNSIWDVNNTGTAYKASNDGTVTSQAQAGENIKRILNDMGVSDE